MLMVLMQLFLGASFFQGNAFFIAKNSIPSWVQKSSRSSLRMQNDAKAELMNYVSSKIKFGEAYEESVGSNVESKISELTSTQSEESIKNSLMHLDGEWLTMYSTLPTLFKSRLPLIALSANTLKSTEPLILISSIKQFVKKIPVSGEYEYDNNVEFQASRKDSPVAPLSGFHITRGIAKFEDGSNVRLGVTFYENEVTSTSDFKELKKLFGFTDEESLLKPFPPGFSSFSDILYLDEDLRIMKGGKNNIYVLKRC